jgi:hypothetical protein
MGGGLSLRLLDLEGGIIESEWSGTYCVEAVGREHGCSGSDVSRERMERTNEGRRELVGDTGCHPGHGPSCDKLYTASIWNRDCQIREDFC